MPLYRQAIKSFFKTKFLSIVFALGSGGGILYYIFQAIRGRTFSTDAMYDLNNSLQLAAVFFILFLFLSFAYFSKSKQVHSEECMRVTAGGLGRFLLAQLSVLLTLAGALAFVMTTVNIAAAMARGVGYREYLLYLLQISFFYFFLLPVVSILFGMVCAAVKKKSVAYVLMAAMVLLTSPLSDMLSDVIYLTTERMNLYPLTDLFRFYPITLHTINYIAAVPVSEKQIQLMSAWLFLLIGLAVPLCFKKEKYTVKAACALSIVICILFGAGTLQTSSDIRQDRNPVNGVFADAWHYMPSDPAKSPEQREEAAAFRVTTYDMEFSVRRLLKATVTVSIDQSQAERYAFTLYHGYKLDCVTDQAGQNLAFSREGDYCTVMPNGETQSLTFTYSGYSAKFYSNSQGVFLPGGFPYYPIAGFHVLFDTATNQQGRIGLALPESVPMTVSVTGGGKIYSNLPETGAGKFSGSSDGLTLMSGFLAEYRSGDVRLVYPYLATADFTPKQIDKEMKSIKDNAKAKNIFIEPQVNLTSNNERFFMLSDHILTNSLYGLGKQIKTAQIPAVKRELYECLEAYGAGKSPVDEYVEEIRSGRQMTEDAERAGSMDWRLAEKIVECGKENVVNRCETYVYDNGDQRTPEEFLAALG